MTILPFAPQPKPSGASASAETARSAHTSGPALGRVVYDPETNAWWAHVGEFRGAAEGQGEPARREAAASALYCRRSQAAIDYLAGLLERHPDRIDDIRYSLTVDYREHRSALGGLATEQDLEVAMKYRRYLAETAEKKAQAARAYLSTQEGATL